VIEVTELPWRYTTPLDALDHWQTGLAGAAAVIAAIATVWAMWSQTATTVRLERERVSSEVDALRKSLAVEFRLQIARAFNVDDGLRELSSTSDGPISARMVESKSRMPAPIIYSANAGKIGLLEGDAMGVAIVYATLEGARLRTDRLATTYNTPDDIGSDVIMETANVFLAARGHAQGVLPRLQTGDASYDAQDEALLQKIKAALATGQA
jgi:hypothetical protein